METEQTKGKGRPKSIILSQTPDEIREERRRCTDSDIREKLLALISYAEGKNRNECGKRVEASGRSVANWVAAYHYHGVEGLADGRKGGNKPSRLSESEQAELARVVAYETPEAHGLEGLVWTGDLIRDHIEKRYGVSYHPHYMSELMERIGLARVRTKGFYPEGDPEAAREFEQKMEQKAQTLEPDEVLLYEDEAGLDKTASLTYAWTFKGQRKAVPQVNLAKERRTIMGTIEPATGQLVQTVCCKGNSETFIKHLEQVKQAYRDKSKIFVVLDNASFHKSVVVKAWLEQNSQLKLINTPPYCPEVNVVERYWKYMRSKIMHNRWVPTMKDREKLLEQWSGKFLKPNPTLRSLCAI